MEKINLTAWACFHNDSCKSVALKTHLIETSSPQIKVAHILYDESYTQVIIKLLKLQVTVSVSKLLWL